MAAPMREQLTMTRNPHDGLNEARDLERIRLSQLMSEGSVEREKEIRALQATAATRGGAGFIIGVTKIIFDHVAAYAGKAIELRRELGAKVPILLTKHELDKLLHTLEQHIDGGVNGVKTRLTMAPRGAGGAGAMQEAHRRAQTIKAQVRQNLIALQLESKIGMNQKEVVPTTTIVISGGTISNLNLGTVIGDLNSSVQLLDKEGHQELATGVKTLTEAVGASEEIEANAKKDILEHLAVVSEEAAKPLEKRRMGPLSKSMEAIKAGVSVGIQLLPLWHQVEQALRNNGIIQ
jgi:hypothetical protein